MANSSYWNFQVPIANPDGTPTDAYMRWLNNQLAIKKVAEAATPQARKIITEGGILGGGDLSHDLTLSLADTGVEAGVYGNDLNVPQITVDSRGRVTHVEQVAISINNSGGVSSGQPFWFKPPKVSEVTKFDPLASGIIISDDTDIGMVCDFNKPPVDCGFQGIMVQLPNPNNDWVFELHYTTNFSGREYWGVMGAALLDLAGGKAIIEGNFPNASVSPDVSTEAYNYPQGWVTNIRSLQKQRFTENFIKVVHTGGNYLFYRSNNGKTYAEPYIIPDTQYTPNKASHIGFGTAIGGGNAVWSYQVILDRFKLV